MTTDFRPVLLMLASTFSLSLNGLLAKWLTDSFSIETLGFLRFILPAVFMLAMLKVSGWVVPARSHWRSITLRSLCIIGSQICFLIALNTLTLIESVVLFSTGPLFIPLLEKMIFKTPVRPLTLACLAITFVGVLLQAESSQGINIRPELLVGLAAGFFNACSQLTLFRGSKSQLPATALNGWCFLMAGLFMLPLALADVWRHGLPELAITAPENLALLFLLLLAVSTTNTQLCRAKAYQYAQTGSQLAPLIYTNLAFALIWQLSFFEQQLHGHQISGIALIIIATVLNTFGPGWLQALRHRRPTAHP
ncbi:DMT family transporter [Photobacterium atrarenae]|uniref:DMT family transporter n=1 Tax=Photobacterium atrarenae TaxID=865757 RepID=A0ABY5GL08_9GAMM|nr:DMT family transporter [Photobacterium atrarenae]UTV29471.1 DMT family transporter [Photobacterium atrarenae]